MKHFTLALIFSFLSSLVGFTQDCQVLDTNIAEKYEGKCKKGLAHGKGKAIGKDTYEGKFKKGKKHKDGVYSWANGDVYKGGFDHDKKHGEGVLIKKNGEKLIGYWKNDIYVGSERSDFLGYKIITHTNIPAKPIFRKKGNDINKIEIKIFDINKNIANFSISNYGKCNLGEENWNPNTGRGSATILDVEYPFKATVKYRASNKSDTFMLDCILMFEITEEGEWEIDISHN